MLLMYRQAAPVLERTEAALPELADAAAYRCDWRGALDITPDWMLDLDGAAITGDNVAAGMSGRGLKFAPARVTAAAKPKLRRGCPWQRDTVRKHHHP